MKTRKKSKHDAAISRAVNRERKRIARIVRSWGMDHTACEIEAGKEPKESKHENN